MVLSHPNSEFWCDIGKGPLALILLWVILEASIEGAVGHSGVLQVGKRVILEGMRQRLQNLELPEESG